ncbi:uncharacterized protein F4817DRAFT_327674 [Daldinia loculata]|uniref:uncharacterized protein n=1 Tax=Daldinia loculata TaxID=103429 RepID=UPI0020C276ED|nr:uncharacterized protein F4817DRAFT_327674 [Daldinia loculata]KAI1650411.1 hypothetical protein F4817DRAFT_327674 [Daldinia loculata]
MALPYFPNHRVNLSIGELRILDNGFLNIEPSAWRTFQTIQDSVRQVTRFATVRGTYVCFCIDTTNITPRTKARDITQVQLHTNPSPVGPPEGYLLL